MKRKKLSQAVEGGSLASPEVERIEHLIRLMGEHNLEEFEYARGDVRIRLRKPPTGVVLAGAAPAAAAVMPVATAPSAGEPGGVAGAADKSAEELHTVKSPIVGTFYESPTPGAEAFVKVGSHVDTGQTLCIVEAMKLMNEIESDVAGEIIRVFVENGQPVEYGQPLFGIRPGRKK
jgi:acetyl-CoA carboxylase biotin carboxyl carrier protein